MQNIPYWENSSDPRGSASPSGGLPCVEAALRSVDTTDSGITSHTLRGSKLIFKEQKSLDEANKSLWLCGVFKRSHMMAEH